MYYQTKHRRPLVGGYVSRMPPGPVARYRQIPGMACVFFGDPDADCGRDTVLAALRQLHVTTVMLQPDDWRNEMLDRHGLTRAYADRLTVVWIPTDLPATLEAPDGPPPDSRATVVAAVNLSTTRQGLSEPPAGAGASQVSPVP